MSAKATPKTLPLKGWQNDIIELIEQYEETRDSDQFQGLSDFQLNRQLSATVALPRGSGHTTFANYIASKYPSLLVYGKMDHYKRITGTFALHQDSDTVSIYEIFHAMYKQNGHPTSDLVELRNKIKSKQVVVIDNALSVSQDMKDFIFDSAGGIIIMLGQ